MAQEEDLPPPLPGPSPTGAPGSSVFSEGSRGSRGPTEQAVLPLGGPGMVTVPGASVPRGLSFLLCKMGTVEVPDNIRVRWHRAQEAQALGSHPGPTLHPGGGDRRDHFHPAVVAPRSPLVT